MEALNGGVDFVGILHGDGSQHATHFIAVLIAVAFAADGRVLECFDEGSDFRTCLPA